MLHGFTSIFFKRNSSFQNQFKRNSVFFLCSLTFDSKVSDVLSWRLHILEYFISLALSIFAAAFKLLCMIVNPERL